MYEMYITAILEIIEVGFYFRIISPHSREVCGPRRFHWLYVPLLRTPMLQSRSRCLASAPDGNARRTLAIVNRRSIRRSAWRYLIDPTSLRKSAVLLRVRLASLTGSFRNRVDGLPVVTGMLPCDDSSGTLHEGRAAARSFKMYICGSHHKTSKPQAGVRFLCISTQSDLVNLVAGAADARVGAVDAAAAGARRCRPRTRALPAAASRAHGRSHCVPLVAVTADAARRGYASLVAVTAGTERLGGVRLVAVAAIADRESAVRLVAMPLIAAAV